MMESLDSPQQKKQVAQLDERDNPVDEHQVTAITPVEVESEDVGSTKRRRSLPRNLLPKLAIGAFLGATAIAGAVYTYRWVQYNRVHLSTDNAYTSADIYPVSSRVSGVVTQVMVKDNGTVNPGMVLFKLDPRESQVSLAKAKAGLNLAKQQAEVARENINNVPSIPRPVGAIGGTTPGQLKPPVINLEPNSKQIEVNRQQYKATLAAIAQKEAEVKEAELKLSYANVTALVPGQVSNSNIRVGQPIQPGQTLVEIVQPNPWIVANFKEEELERIQPGQKAEIKIAAFPSRKFIGRVESISSNPINRVVTPSPQTTPGGNYSNAASNIGRIPVKIVFEPESLKDFQSRIAPGMSADVIISTKRK